MPASPPQVGTVSIKKSGRERFQQATGLPAPEVNGKAFPIQLGFTKTNELFVGRLAMLGFAASLVGELLTGQGALAQFGYGEQGGRSGAYVGLRLYATGYYRYLCNLVAGTTPFASQLSC